MEQRVLTCIGCPLGCAVTVRLDKGEICGITGNTCKIGESYAKKEVTAPERIVTTTVRVEGGACPVTSVKTAGGVPREKVFDVMEALKQVRLEAPVSIGDVAAPDICGTGVDVTVTKAVKRL